MMWNMARCGMSDNARCGKLRHDVKCGDEECGMCNALYDCDVRCEK